MCQAWAKYGRGKRKKRSECGCPPDNLKYHTHFNISLWNSQGVPIKLPAGDSWGRELSSSPRSLPRFPPRQLLCRAQERNHSSIARNHSSHPTGLWRHWKARCSSEGPGNKACTFQVGSGLRQVTSSSWTLLSVRLFPHCATWLGSHRAFCH